MQIMFNDIEVRARRARNLATCVNSLTQLKAKLHFNQHGGIATKAKYGRIRATNKI
jgi:hypothetical protein